MEGTNYPFIEANDIRGLITDMYLGHRVRTAALPLRLKWLYGVTNPPGEGSSQSSSSSSGLPAPAHAADIWIVDANDDTVFLSTTGTHLVNPWGNFLVHEWRTDVAVCRLVQTTTGFESLPVEMTPDLIIDERVSEIWPLQVQSITVNNQKLANHVEIVGGYNSTITLSSQITVPGTRFRNRVFLGGEAGTGEGLYPGCEDPVIVIRRINQVSPSKRGNFTLTANDCYWINRGGSTTKNDGEYVLNIAPAVEYGLQMHNDCRPCCACDDYVNTYKGIRKLYDQFKEIGNRAQVVRGQYEANRERWLASKECRINRPVRIEMLPYKVGGLNIGVTFCNTTGSCLGKLKLDIEFVTSGPVGTPIEDATLWYPTDGGHPELIKLDGAWPKYWAIWEPVDTSRAAKLRFQMGFSGASRADWVTATATPYINDSATPLNGASLTRSLVV